MKILLLASNFPPDHGGGYGQVAGAFADGLAQRGHHITVQTRTISSSNPTPITNGELPILRTLRDIRHGMSPGDLYRNTLHNAREFRKSLRVIRPDVILSCGNEGIGFQVYHEALSAQHQAGVPCLTYLGDTWLAQAWRSLPKYDPWIDFARGGRRRGFNRVLKRALGRIGSLRGLITTDKPLHFQPVTAISRFVVDDLRAAGAPVADSVPMTYVPLDRAYFREGQPIGPDGTRSSVLRALFVSRVEPLKGPDVAISAVAGAVKQGANVTLTIAGLGLEKMKPVLQQQAQNLSIADRVTFAGTPSSPELVNLYRRHDVFLFPSRIVEGLGLVNCEAQACGLPIIGTADSGAAEVIRHEETGFRIAIDDVESMARHLGQLARDRLLWEHLSKNAMDSAKRFHPDRILDVLETALHDTVRS